MQKPCDVCGKEFEAKGKKKFCGEACAKVRQLQQLAALAEKRKGSVGWKKTGKTCLICQEPFMPKKGPQKYCSRDCSDKGLTNAIQRQRERRERAKMVRQEEALKPAETTALKAVETQTTSN